jgi:hypothetical protein
MPVMMADHISVMPAVILFPFPVSYFRDASRLKHRIIMHDRRWIDRTPWMMRHAFELGVQKGSLVCPSIMLTIMQFSRGRACEVG